jgi:asparagine synthase (glutamine-hydrolysing)
LSGLIAVLGLPREDALAAAKRMAAAAPHRGSAVESVTCGAYVLGAMNPTEEDRPREASLASDDGWAAAFVGRLENTDEVRDRLAVGTTGAHTPAGLVISAFRALGDGVPNVLRGAYAAVVTDGRRTWCFRDHVGFETLFHQQDDGVTYVASEAKQVLAGSGLPREPDLEVLEQIFYDSLEDESRSALRGVRRLLAGAVMEVEGKRVRWRWYWHPEAVLETARISAEDVPAAFEEAMTRAVTRVLTGHDAVSLSGGIDSPALAAFAAPAHRRLYGRPLAAVSAVYPGFVSADETPYIEEVASSLDIPLHTYEPRPQRLTRLREWVELFDGPWPTWSPLGAEQRLGYARELGLRTILDGNLAEQVMAMQRFLVAHLLARGRFLAALGYLRRDRSAGAPTRRILRQLATPLVPRWAVRAYLRRNPLLALPEWLDPRRSNEARLEAARPLRQMWVASQLGGFRGSSLALEASSILHASFGIRERMPWGDVDLWEFFLSLPAEIKFPGPQMKGLVRQLLRGKVPDRILDRTDKTVLNEWFEATSIDYPSLRRWLADPPYRVPGVDYQLLGEQLEREDMDLPRYVWAKDLAGIHAFLDLW